MSTPSQGAQLSALRVQLEDALQAGQLRPENTEWLARVLSPIEQAVASLPHAPFDGEGASGQIPNLLWCKSHPEGADPALLLRQIESPTPIVRMLAAGVLGQMLDHSLDSKFLYHAKLSLQKQKAKETSPVVNLLLTDLLTRIARMTATTRIQAAESPSVSSPSVSPVKSNPYNAGLPIRSKEGFFGRAKILGQIASILGRDEGVKSIVLVGARRTGKTSLLYQIAGGALGEGFIACRVDLQALPTPDLDGMLRLMGKSLLEMCAPAAALAATGNIGNPYEVAKAAIARACSSFAGRRVLILVDEYEVLEKVLQDHQNAVRLQGILENEQRLFFVFAGAQKPESLNQHGLLLLLDNSRTINISFLEPEEARQLITQQLGDYLTYDSAAIELIQSLCHGHPFYTQLLCQMIFDAKPGGGRVSEADIAGVVQQFMRNPSAHTILTWKGLTRPQKLAAACVAAWTSGGSFIGMQQIQSNLATEHYPGAPSQPELQRSLRDLQELDLLEKQEGATAFRFPMDLLRRWIAENRTIWDVKQEFAADYRPASLKRRLAAGALDFLISTGICFGIFTISRTPTIWSMAVVLFLYFVVVSAMAGFTFGMRLFDMRFLRADGRTLHPLRLAILGAMGAFEWALLPWLILRMIYQHWNIRLGPLALGFGWVEGISVALLAIEFVHLARIALNRRNRGLYEELVGAMVVKQKGDA